MPVVPFAKKQPMQAQPPQVDPNFLLMAAAMMHKEGRLGMHSALTPATSTAPSPVEKPDA